PGPLAGHRRTCRHKGPARHRRRRRKASAGAPSRPARPFPPAWRWRRSEAHCQRATRKTARRGWYKNLASRRLHGYHALVPHILLNVQPAAGPNWPDAEPDSAGRVEDRPAVCPCWIDMQGESAPSAKFHRRYGPRHGGCAMLLLLPGDRASIVRRWTPVGIAAVLV